MTPSITVLTTVYNGTLYLREAIESVLGQSFHDFEFLIIDDASTDDSVEMIRSWKDDRLRLVCNEKNIGQAASLNKGLKLAGGKYIARLDQDDACLPDRLKEQFEFMERHPRVVVVCTWEYTVDSRGRKVRQWREMLDDYGQFVGKLILGKCPVWHPSVMFRSDVVKELGGYDVSFAPSEDFDLWNRIAMKRYSGAIIPRLLVLQRVHAGRQSVTRADAQKANLRRSHERLLQELAGIQDVRLMGSFLRLEEAFWEECATRTKLDDVLDSLQHLLAGASAKLQMTERETARMKRIVYRRLGLGVTLTGSARALPSYVFYPVFWTLSPLLIPRVKPILASIYARFQELRYPGRLIYKQTRRVIKKEI